MTEALTTAGILILALNFHLILPIIIAVVVRK